jgi:hypothetical protein
MSDLNAAWHRSHPMPESPTLDQRVAWHVEHARECACREIPESIVRELRRRGMPVPERRPRTKR